MALAMHWAKTLSRRKSGRDNKSNSSKSVNDSIGGFPFNATEYEHSERKVLWDQIFIEALNHTNSNRNSTSQLKNAFMKKTLLLNDMDTPPTGTKVHPHSFTMVMIIASMFLFFTVAITIAVIIFCRKKNMVFAFQKSEQEDEGEYELDDMDTDYDDDDEYDFDLEALGVTSSQDDDEEEELNQHQMPTKRLTTLKQKHNKQQLKKHQKQQQHLYNGGGRYHKVNNPALTTNTDSACKTTTTSDINLNSRSKNYSGVSALEIQEEVAHSPIYKPKRNTLKTATTAAQPQQSSSDKRGAYYSLKVSDAHLEQAACSESDDISTASSSFKKPLSSASLHEDQKKNFNNYQIMDDGYCCSNSNDKLSSDKFMSAPRMAILKGGDCERYNAQANNGDDIPRESLTVIGDIQLYNVPVRDDLTSNANQAGVKTNDVSNSFSNNINGIIAHTVGNNTHNIRSAEDNDLNSIPYENKTCKPITSNDGITKPGNFTTKQIAPEKYQQDIAFDNGSQYSNRNHFNECNKFETEICLLSNDYGNGATDVISVIKQTANMSCNPSKAVVRLKSVKEKGRDLSEGGKEPLVNQESVKKSYNYSDNPYSKSAKTNDFLRSNNRDSADNIISAFNPANEMSQQYHLNSSIENDRCLTTAEGCNCSNTTSSNYVLKKTAGFPSIRTSPLKGLDTSSNDILHSNIPKVACEMHTSIKSPEAVTSAGPTCQSLPPTPASIPTTTCQSLPATPQETFNYRAKWVTFDDML